MSFTNITNNTKVVDSNLVEKILEQGQKLRNSMVESILKNDPFYTDVIYTKHFNTPKGSSVEMTPKKTSDEASKLIESYLKGEYMTSNEEKLALDTIRSMSVPDLFKTTERSLFTNRTDCKCSTCTEYCERNLNCDLRRSDSEKHSSLNFKMLRLVDCLKISVHSLFLNEAGYSKVYSKCDSKTAGFTQRYFLEYKIPERIAKKYKSSSKVDSGLDHNFVRICSRQNNETIVFKNVVIHDICNLENNLETTQILFKVSHRNSRLKNSELLGYSKFDFATFKVCKNLTFNKELPVYLENSPIIVGYLKISIQLGCGRIYFGKEFLEAINTTNKKDPVVLHSDDEISEKNIILKMPNVPKKLETNKTIIDAQTSTNDFVTKDISDKNQSAIIVKFPNKIDDGVLQKELLFGFIYIAEARFNSAPINSCVTFQPFCQNDTCSTRNVPNSSNPVYNFSQLIPLIYDDDLLLSFRENFMLLEFWDKSHVDNVFGLAKVPLHQFYTTYRNPIILKYLSKNKFPTISTDNWEPIYSLENDVIIGEVQVLLALGTEEQIKNLQIERGFKNNIVQSKPTKKSELKSIEHLKLCNDRIKLNTKHKLTDKATNTTSTNLVSPRKSPKKVNVGIQSESKMDDPKKISPTQEILGNFLSQILAQKQQNVYVENSTNTESLPQSSKSNTEVRKTSDLLDTLQKALTIDTNRLELTRDDIFKVRVSINSANQLPLKRRYKSKKTRSRKEQIEEALPSTYVTFETNPQGNLKITQVVPKSTTPKYDFVTEVNLPTDLLTNNQKKLIFKVWKKSTNITSTPNLQTDIILGFATLDLTVLLAGLPNVQGWFNIIDFSGKINGQVNIHVDPLEDLSKFHKKHPEKTSSQPNLDIELNPDEPSELIGRALKRKFTELDEITQRLRLRLSEVTREDSDCSNDEFEQQFEQDINSLSIEEDFNKINFEGGENSRQNSKTKGFDLLSFASEGSSKSADHDSNEVLLSNSEVSNKLLSNSEASNNLLSNSEVSDQNGKVPQEDSSRNSEVSKDSLLLEERSLDRNLLEGKQKIDSLLEKLSLISNETVQPFGSRYVSGCSISNNDNQIDTEAILKDLDKYSRPNIQSNNIFDSDMFKRLYTGQSPENSSSNTSILTINCGDFRGVPEGEGPNSDDKVLKKS